MNLATTIRQHRKQAHLSQEHLAEQLHVSRQTISNWENGKSLPDIYSLIALSDLFALSLDDFIKGDRVVQAHLNAANQITPLFIAGSLFTSFLTVLNNRLMNAGIDGRLAVTLVIGQLLFSIFILFKGRDYAQLRLASPAIQMRRTSSPSASALA